MKLRLVTTLIDQTFPSPELAALAYAKTHRHGVGGKKLFRENGTRVYDFDVEGHRFERAYCVYVSRGVRGDK